MKFALGVRQAGPGLLGVQRACRFNHSSMNTGRHGYWPASHWAREPATACQGAPHTVVSQSVCTETCCHKAQAVPQASGASWRWHACCGRAGMQIRKRSSRESTYTQSLVLKRSVVLYCQAVGVHCETTTGGCIHSDAIASTGRRRSCTLAVVAIIASSVLDLCAGSCSATCVVCSRAKHCRGCLA